jgi:hypothetical protein
MKFNEHFIAGRLKRRILRAPAIDGWLCEESNVHPPERTSMAMTKLAGVLALKLPGAHDSAKLSAAASEVVNAGGDVDILIGWPESLVVLRQGGGILHAEGDVVHFGRLSLDANHWIERTGYEYLAEEGIEVRVELTLSALGNERKEMLGPGQTTELGPYAIEHQRSFDPSDRPSGANQHGYSFVVRRKPGAPPPPAPPAGLPHPLDIERPEQVVTLARNNELLATGEALLAEPKELSRVLEFYEGPRQKLEQLIRDTGETVLRRRGEVVEVESSHLGRGVHGEAIYGRATVSLDPARGLSVTRNDREKAPGRMRRQPTGDPINR